MSAAVYNKLQMTNAKVAVKRYVAVQCGGLLKQVYLHVLWFKIKHCRICQLQILYSLQI